jgi:type IV pilus assembly protein PilA
MVKSRKAKAGFTIIELLVVIAILAILAAIVLINIISYIKKGQDAAAREDANTLLTNAISYYFNNPNHRYSFNGVDSDPDYQNVYNKIKDDLNYSSLQVQCEVNNNQCDPEDPDCSTDCSNPCYSNPDDPDCNPNCDFGCNSDNATKWCASFREQYQPDNYAEIYYCIDSSGNRLEGENAVCGYNGNYGTCPVSYY